ncbi:hypothetical protein AAMO2058_000894800 [Amorphochlora amoebiformis]|mmetsp:Transcript_4975/g.7562  ORF Transcript_4975/g.7562 Transcript_4975/m.7562 type:complete len:236 (-) Transcript_4975:91-798(-)
MGDEESDQRRIESKCGIVEGPANGAIAEGERDSLPELVRTLVETAKRRDNTKNLYRHTPNISDAHKKFLSETKQCQETTKLINIKTFVDLNPYRSLSKRYHSDGSSGSKRAIKNWSPYPTKSIDLGCIPIEHAKQFAFRIQIQSKRFTLTELDISFQEAKFLEGRYRGMKLAPGQTHLTTVKLIDEIKCGDHHGYIKVKASSRAGVERFRIVAFAHVTDTSRATEPKLTGCPAWQ